MTPLRFVVSAPSRRAQVFRRRKKSALDHRRNLAPVSFLVSILQIVRARRPSRAQHMDRMGGAMRILETNFTHPLSALDNLGNRAKIIARNLLHSVAILRAALQVASLMMQHIKRLAILVDHIQNRAHHFDKLAARVTSRPRPNRRQQLDKLRHHRLRNQRNNLVLAIQVEVDRSRRDPSLERKLLNRSLMKRLPRQHSTSSQKNLSPPRLDQSQIRSRSPNSLNNPCHQLLSTE